MNIAITLALTHLLSFIAGGYMYAKLLSHLESKLREDINKALSKLGMKV